MIQVIVKKKSENITGFHIEGHSGYAEYGSDIICAAVSALAINCVNSIEEFTEDAYVIEQEEKRGMIDFQLTVKPSEQSKLLLDSMVFGIREISRQYGSQYVTLINR
ncbi:MAG: ribosomal-processing cysteine protease Prp [Lachnospiraceae bacterium]|nr:ribosomal-processing cysteine protease Prp [Lachnospiraceae bacterium]